MNDPTSYNTARKIADMIDSVPGYASPELLKIGRDAERIMRTERRQLMSAGFTFSPDGTANPHPELF